MMQAMLRDLPVFEDARGSLMALEEGGLLPFTPRRLFTLFNIFEDATRGHHAHREQHQFLIAMSGRCVVKADNGVERADFVLSSPRLGLYAPPLVWLDLADFAPGTVCAVLTSDRFDEGDYVRDYNEFKRLTTGA